MACVRRRYRWLAALWLCSQVTLLALTSATIAAMPVGTGKHCDCPGTTARVCVMHRGSAPTPLSARQCAMRHSPTPDITIVTIAPGFSLKPIVWIHEAETRLVPAAHPVLTLDRSAPPDAPPPRA